MKIYATTPFSLSFKGKREDRKSVEQLKKDNAYDLNVINQRNISKAIDNLSKVPGEDNVKFLLDVSENLKYGTNIDLGKQPYHDWRVKLNDAAKKSLALSDAQTQKRLSPKLDAISSSKKDLSEEEVEILNLRKSILDKVDKNQLENIKNDNIKELNRNIDYFIISSEIPISQKLYIMKRLDYFMSPEYKINEQLKDKKTQALAEMFNDMVVNTPESKIPNIKSVNQKTHGMCAAISICRKDLAYEDKANYVDMILSELDDSPYMQVYDITKLGSHTKVPIQKADIDYNYALSQGFRIIDTSALNWMNVANTAGATNEFVGLYKAFDKNNFDTFQDSHLTIDVEDRSLVDKQDWYRTLSKAKNAIGEYKRTKLKQQYKKNEIYSSREENIQRQIKYNAILTDKIKGISPEISKDKVVKLYTLLINQEIPNSEALAKVEDSKKAFTYLPNEPEQIKVKKIKDLLKSNLSGIDNINLDDEKAKEILVLAEELRAMQYKQKTSYAGRNILKAQLLYDAAAAYRTQQIYQLYIPEQLDDMLNNLNIPDSETLISKNMDYLISKLQNNSISPELKAALAKNLSTDNDTEALVESLKANKETFDYVLTKLLDDLYYCTLSVNRKTVLANELSGIRNSIAEENDKKALLEMSDRLHIKDNKKQVLNTLDKYIETLKSDNCTEDQYIEIFNKTGHKSQMLMFKNNFERLGEILFKNQDSNPVIIQGFNKVNGLPIDASREQSIEMYNKLADAFNRIVGLVTSFQNSLDVVGEDGEFLNTVDGKKLVVKKLENHGEIISSKDLKMLNEKFTKIKQATINSSGIPTHYKDLPKELTTFTPREKAVLNQIDERINGWYSIVTRALNYQYREIKEPLSEMNRQIGVKIGMNWIAPEGHSGLSSSQEVKIIEHMTDRPYYTENNRKYAIKKIKQSPYSGISTTSVDSSQPAWHAQYIADIRPVEVDVDGKKEIKEALFHDNTWGPLEHENTWVDDQGLLRTDYARGYGGELGYITDDAYLTGKLVDNLIDSVGVLKREDINNKQYRKMAGAAGEYKYPMFVDIITPGRHPKAEQYVRMMRDVTFINSSEFLQQLETAAKNMTKSEIKSVILKAETLNNNLYKEYSEYENRIFGRPPFDKGIVTKEDYDKLSKNDPLRLIFEKMALIRSYKGLPNRRIFYKQTSNEDLATIRQQIKIEARKNFDYVFAKNPEIVNYGAESVRQELDALLGAFAQVNGFKLSNTVEDNIINSLKNIDKKEFDGSLDKTIELMVNNFANSLTKNTPKQIENKDEKVKDMANKVRNMLRTNMGFTLADLGSSSFDDDNMKDIVKWIDDTFDPATDEELVQIINNLRNMTKEEFERKYNSKITDAAIGIKPVSGYDVLQQFRGMDSRTHDMLYNLLFNQKLGVNLKMSTIIPVYEYNKINRKLRSARYDKNKRTFDDIYLDYYYSLRSLTLSKQYRALRQEAFDKYRTFPAYPKYDPETKEFLQQNLKRFYDDISENMEAIYNYNIQDETLNIVNDMYKSINNLPDGELTTRQYNKFHKYASDLLEVNGEDETIPKTIAALKQMTEFDKTVPSSEYKRLIKEIYDEIHFYNTTVDGKTMKQAANETLKDINSQKKEIISYIDPKYQSRAAELLNKWISDSVKQRPDSDRYYEEFCQLYSKHIITRTPEKLLNEYLMLLAKPDKGELPAKKDAVSENLEESLKSDIKGLLYQASLLEMQYILMNCAGESNLNVVRDEFKKSKIQLKNGSVVTLDSDIAINIMLAPLLADEDLEPAKMFLEQLGLSERIVDMVSKNKSLDRAKKYVKRINNIFSSVAQQTSIVKSELDKIGDIDNDPNYEEKLDIMHDNIVRKFKNTNYRITIKIMDKAFSTLKEDIKNNPDKSKTALLYLKMEEAKTAFIAAGKYQVDILNTELKAIQKVKDLIVELKLPENSPAIKQREDYLKRFHEVVMSITPKHYEELGLATDAGTRDV